MKKPNDGEEAIRENKKRNREKRENMETNGIML